MGILDEVTPKRNQAHAIIEFLESLSKAERAEWDLVLLDLDKYANRTITLALERRGINVNENAVYRFRRQLKENPARGK
jgi:ABC-type uncharacterized transport system involved in gliding motility auxiliary subunit